MKRKYVGRVITILCVGILMAIALVGCTSQDEINSQQAQLDRREYMSQVNQIADDLQSRLENFTDAVSRNDVVTMRTQADTAFETLDQLEALEVPEGLEDIHDGYVEGTTDLKEALNSYIDLYTEIESATDDQPFDWSTYDKRIGDIQEKYNAGIDAITAADEAAAEME